MDRRGKASQVSQNQEILYFLFEWRTTSSTPSCLHRLRNSDAKTTGIKSSSAGEQSHAAPNRSVKTKGNKIEDDSEEEEDEGDDSEDQGDNEEMVSEVNEEKDRNVDKLS